MPSSRLLPAPLLSLLLPPLLIQQSHLGQGLLADGLDLLVARGQGPLGAEDLGQVAGVGFRLAIPSPRRLVLAQSRHRQQGKRWGQRETKVLSS
jgi:hypothetical protein